jgi:hypothetical protein
MGRAYAQLLCQRNLLDVTIFPHLTQFFANSLADFAHGLLSLLHCSFCPLELLGSSV